MRLVGLPPSRRGWVFGVRNTLHDAQGDIFPSMHDQITLYLMRRFDLDEAGANRMRRGFWQRYGTTMNGLMRHYGTDPRGFLAATPQFPALADMLGHEAAVRHALARLPGRTIRFSNPPRR